jgi:hypothetical protein
MSDLTIPNNFSSGQIAFSALVDANFAAIATWANGNVDNTNIGAAGIYASQIVPTNGTQATFGGSSSINYQFPGTLSVGGPEGAFAAGFPGAITSATSATEGGIAFGSGVAGQTSAIAGISNQISFFPNTSIATPILGINELNMASVVPFSPGNGTIAGTAAIYGGTGSPSGSLSAPNGSLFLRYDGGSSTRLYINTSGASTSGTAWTAVTD